jgi:Putative auto-transporter adhesin, head GIN domain
MKHKMCAAVVVGTVSLAISSAWSQTSVIQQNNASSQTSVTQQNSVSVNGEGSSVTISGGTITVDTRTSGRGRVVGNGQRASEERPIGPITAIRSDGALQLTVKNGLPPSLTVEADKNILPIIKTTVTNGQLEIYSVESYSTDGRINVSVSSPNITDISTAGSNRITAEGFDGGPLSIVMNGSSSAVLAGKVASLTCVMGGANHLTAQQLAADSANITLNGSGDASVDARRQIVAQISGAGSITVYGNPKERNTQVNGAGRITFVE